MKKSVVFETMRAPYITPEIEVCEAELAQRLCQGSRGNEYGDTGEDIGNDVEPYYPF